MTLAIFLPLAFVFVALVEVMLFKHWHAQGMISQQAMMVMMSATILLPVIIYVVLTFVLPDIGAIEIF